MVEVDLETRTTKLELRVDVIERGQQTLSDKLDRLTEAVQQNSAQSHADRGKTNRLLISILAATLAFFAAYLLDPQGENGVLAALVGALKP